MNAPAGEQKEIILLYKTFRDGDDGVASHRQDGTSMLKLLYQEYRKGNL
jgi:hypothetical protein